MQEWLPEAGEHQGKFVEAAWLQQGEGISLLGCLSQLMTNDSSQ